MPINELRSITTFVNTAELGSLRRAAQTLGVTPQAASQALAQLEQHLGVRLFHRTTRHMALTDEGRQFLEAVQPSLLGLQRALQIPRRAKDDIAGPLRIVGPRSSFWPVLWPVLDELCRRHPDVQPDVQMDDRIGNWVEDRVDVGFRIGAMAAEGVIARRLFTLQLIPCATPAYIARHGMPATLDDLASHRCSVFRSSGTGRAVPWHLKVDDSVVDLDVVPAFCTNDETMEMQAVLDGQVIALVTGVIAAPLIREGRLVPLLTRHVSDHLGMHVYYGSRRSQPARVRAFIDLAVEMLKDNPAFVLTPKELATAETKARKAWGSRKAG
ncbi:MAG TPA: LysR family transcriptional regulator [Candidatus Aquabacterium excrementipullorum]|nr:LysR family transcriptional regulator [Candidatus Aquabacterium excrementipullorum]